ncbi:MAG: hypothetical protein AAF602_22045, partial [Myxococcota bacterium]
MPPLATTLTLGAFLALAPPAHAQSPADLVIVDATTDTDFADLADGQTLFLGDLPAHWSLRTASNTLANPVCFELDGAHVQCESFVPFAVAGDIQGDYFPFDPGLGIHTLDVYADDALVISTTFTVTDECTLLDPGCTYPTACNYDPTAIDDDGSCGFAAPGLDCAGECLHDDDLDGICDEDDTCDPSGPLPPVPPLPSPAPTVCDGVNDVNVVPIDFATIQQAIDRLPDGSTICLAEGTHPDTFDASGRALTLSGTIGTIGTTLDLSGTVGSHVTVASGASHLTLTNLNVAGLDRAGSFSGAFLSQSGGDVTLDHVRLTAHRITLSDDPGDFLRGGLVDVVGGTLRLSTVWVDTVDFVYANGAGNNPVILDGGVVHVASGALLADGLDVRGLTLSGGPVHDARTQGSFLDAQGSIV